MIYLHRFQTSDFRNSDLNKERFDGITTEMRYLPLADNLVLSETHSTYPVLDTFKNLLSTEKDVIVDCKESGVEDKLLSKIGFRNNFYFLNSDIQDIIRLCKSHSALIGHFIVRVSLFEGFPNKLVEFCKPEKFWIDASLCNGDCKITDLMDLTTCKHTITNLIENIVSSSACYGLEPEIILASPDVNDVDSDFQIEFFRNYYKSLDADNISVCTKFPDIFE